MLGFFLWPYNESDWSYLDDLERHILASLMACFYVWATSMIYIYNFGVRLVIFVVQICGISWFCCVILFFHHNIECVLILVLCSLLVCCSGIVSFF